MSVPFRASQTRGAIVALILVAMMPVAGCTEERPPTFEVPPTPTIPAHFARYTEEGLFTLYYPSEWEVDTSFLFERDVLMREALKTKATDFPVGDTAAVLVAGRRGGKGFPFVAVVAEAMGIELTVDEYYEGNIAYLSEFLTGFKEFSQSKVWLAGREVWILDFEVDVSNYVRGPSGKQRNIRLVAVDGTIGWDVQCNVASVESPTSTDIEDCNAVLRSFQLLTPQ